jgi:hypothetical protein
MGVRRAALPIVALLALIAFAVVSGAREQPVSPSAGPDKAASVANLSSRAHPQAIEPVAGQASRAVAAGAPAQVGASSTTGALPGSSAVALPKPASDSMVKQELVASGLAANPNRAVLTPDGLAIAPLGAPLAVQEVIQAGNQIAHLPYRYGGGHVTYQDTAYDCSGSISYVFEAAHLLSGSVVSGNLARWGDSGPGKWITVFANAGHTFIYVAGLRFDTVALGETGDRWSTRSADEPDLRTFAVRHPRGL